MALKVLTVQLRLDLGHLLDHERAHQLVQVPLESGYIGLVAGSLFGRRCRLLFSGFLLFLGLLFFLSRFVLLIGTTNDLVERDRGPRLSRLFFLDFGTRCAHGFRVVVLTVRQ